MGIPCRNGTTTLSIMAFSIITLPLFWMSHFIYCYTECRFAECSGALENSKNSLFYFFTAVNCVNRLNLFRRLHFTISCRLDNWPISIDKLLIRRKWFEMIFSQNFLFQVSNLWLDQSKHTSPITGCKLFSGLHHKTFYGRNEICSVLSSSAFVVSNFLQALTNTLPFYVTKFITSVKSLMIHTSGVCTVKHYGW